MSDGASGAAAAGEPHTGGNRTVDALEKELNKWRERVPRLAAALKERSDEVEQLKRQLAAGPDSGAGGSGIQARDALIQELEAKLKALNGKHQDAQGQLHARDMEVNALREEALEWREKWQQVTTSLDSQSDLVTGKDREIARLRSELEETTALQEQQALAAKQQELELTTLREAGASLESRNEKLFETTELANRQIASLGEDLDRLRSSVKQKEAELAEQATRHQQLGADLETLKGQVASRDQDIEFLHSHVKTKQAEINQLSERLAEIEVLQSANDLLTKEKTELEATLVAERDALEQQLAAERSEHEQSLAGEKERIEQSLLAEKQALEQNLRAEKDQLEQALTAERDELRSALENEQTTRVGLEQRLAEVERRAAELDAAGATLEALQADMSERDAQLASGQAELDETTRRAEELEREVERLEECVAQAHESNEQREDERRQLSEQMNEAKRRAQHLETQLSERSSLVVGLEQEKSAINDRTAALEAENARLSAALEKSERNATEHGDHLAQLDGRLERQKQLMENLEKEYAQVQQQLADANKAHALELAEKSTELGALRQQLEVGAGAASDAELEALESRLAEAGRALEAAEARASEHEELAAARARELEALRGKEASATSGLDEKISRLEDQLREQTEALRSAEADVARLRSERDSALAAARPDEPAETEDGSDEDLLREEVLKLERMVRERTEQLNQMRWHQEMAEKQAEQDGSDAKMLVVLNQQLLSTRDDNRRLRDRLRELEGEQARASTGGDDLSRIKGVGPKLVDQLAELGVTRFDQIATLSEADLDDEQHVLHMFKGRILKDGWIEQAARLAD